MSVGTGSQTLWYNLTFLSTVEHIPHEIWEGFKDTTELGGSWKMRPVKCSAGSLEAFPSYA